MRFLGKLGMTLTPIVIPKMAIIVTKEKGSFKTFTALKLPLFYIIKLLNFLKTSVFKVTYKVDIKFPYIKTRYVFSVKVNHISVGNSPFSRGFQQCKVFSPRK